MWAKISTSTTTMLCAACIATAATLPVMGAAADEVARLNADVNLKVNVANLDAFDAIPSFVGILNGIGDQDLAAIIEALGGLDSTSAVPSLVALLQGDLTGLDGLDSTSGISSQLAILQGLLAGDSAAVLEGLGGLDLTNGIPPVVEFLQTGNVDALADLDSVSAIPVVIGTDGVLTGGGLDALEGLDSLSAVPVVIGTDGVLTGGGVDALADLDSLSAIPVVVGTDGLLTGGGLGALRGLDAFSAIPEYLQIPEPVEPVALRVASAPVVEEQTQDSSTGLVGSGNPLRAVAQRVTGALPNRAPEAAPQVVEQEVAPENSGEATQNITRESKKFSPERIGDSPILFRTGAPGVDNGIRGWGSALKKLGIGGGDAAGGGEAEGADGGAGGGEN